VIIVIEKGNKLYKMSHQAIPPALPERGKFSSNLSSGDGTTLASSQAPTQAPMQPQHVFTASGLAARKTAPAPIYKWEAGSAKTERSELIVGNQRFVPSDCTAVYTTSSAKSSGDESNSQEYVDFQVILTREEMEVLAARRKKLHFTATANAQNMSSINGVDKAVLKSHVASMSLSKSTPYVDSRRIQNELLIRR
jgi:hypothetical protein